MSPAELSSSEAERLRAFERQGHDALATSYHAFFAAVTALATNPLLDAVRLRPATRLLDVATGPGALAAVAASRGARPVGTDLSPQMIELARRLHPAIDFREADVEHLPFSDHAFDVVVCAFGLGHFPQPEAAVAECVRTLLPGGHIALSWWDDSSRQRIQGIIQWTEFAGRVQSRLRPTADLIVRGGIPHSRSPHHERRRPCAIGS